MRARAAALAAIGSVAVLTIGWQLGARSGPAPVAAPSTARARADAVPSKPSTDSSGPTRPGSTAAAGPSGRFVGSVEQTPYGTVQVAAVERSGRLVDVQALRLTDQGGRSVAISAGAAPRLRTEALTAQSARIDTVSGATYTSDGYRRSLQAALDAAGR